MGIGFAVRRYVASADAIRIRPRNPPTSARTGSVNAGSGRCWSATVTRTGENRNAVTSLSASPVLAGLSWRQGDEIILSPFVDRRPAAWYRGLYTTCFADPWATDAPRTQKGHRLSCDLVKQYTK